MAQWYYTTADQEHGPLTSPQLKQLATSGKLQPTDLVWKDGMANWVEAQRIKGLFDSTPKRGTAPPSNIASPPSPSPSQIQEVSPSSSSADSSLLRRNRKPLFVAGIAGIVGLLAVILLAVFLWPGGDDDGSDSSERGSSGESVAAPDFSDVDYSYDYSNVDYTVPKVDYSKGPKGEKITTKEFRQGATGDQLNDFALPFVRQQGFNSQAGWVPHGVTTVYLRDKETKTHESQWYNGKHHGWLRTYSEGGSNRVKSEATYIHDKMTGVMRTFSGGNKVGEWQIYDGKRHGTATEWHPNGQIKEKSTFVNDIRHGLRTLFHPNGKKRAEAYFLNGSTHGSDKEWHKNGQLKFQQTWVKGKRHGPYAEWHDNGQKFYIGSMKDGEETGNWKTWHPTGEKWYEMTFLKGVKVGREVGWAPDGHVIFEAEWNGQPSSYRAGYREGWALAEYRTGPHIRTQQGRKSLLEHLRKLLADTERSLDEFRRLPPANNSLGRQRMKSGIERFEGRRDGMRAAMNKKGIQP